MHYFTVVDVVLLASSLWRVCSKVVKQTVMTSVYGVTFVGAREQIYARLKEKFAHDTSMPPDRKDELLRRSSMYLAKVTLESIGELFYAADKIKQWLTNCARLVRRAVFAGVGCREPVCLCMRVRACVCVCVCVRVHVHVCECVFVIVVLATVPLYASPSPLRVDVVPCSLLFPRLCASPPRIAPLCVRCCCMPCQIAEQGQPVAWITPLGLPVVQPYRRFNSLIIKTVMQDVLMADNDEQLPVALKQQRTAFPPNFVHSLDSTHVSAAVASFVCGSMYSVCMRVCARSGCCACDSACACVLCVCVCVSCVYACRCASLCACMRRECMCGMSAL
jgi:DNA-directed RNA polymerase